MSAEFFTGHIPHSAFYILHFQIIIILASRWKSGRVFPKEKQF